MNPIAQKPVTAPPTETTGTVASAPATETTGTIAFSCGGSSSGSSGGGFSAVG